MNYENFYYKQGTENRKLNTRQMLYANAKFDIETILSDKSTKRCNAVTVITPSQSVSVAFDHSHETLGDQVAESKHSGIADIILSNLYPDYATPQEGTESVYFGDKGKETNIFILMLEAGPVIFMPEYDGISEFQYNNLSKYIEEVENSDYAKKGLLEDNQEFTVTFANVNDTEIYYSNEFDKLNNKMEKLKEHIKFKDIPEQFPISEFDFSDCKTDKEIWEKAGEYAEQLENYKHTQDSIAKIDKSNNMER